MTIGLVGGGKGGLALLNLIHEWPTARVAVVVDPRPDAPALGKARALGIPTRAHHLEVFAYPVDLVLEVTGQPSVLGDLLRGKPADVEVIGAGSLRFFWDLLQDKVETAHQFQALLEASRAVGRSLNVDETIRMILGEAREVLGVASCGLMSFDPPTGELRSVGSLDLAEEVLSRIRLKVGEGIAGRAVKERRSVQSEDLYTDPRVLYPALPRQSGLRSLLCVPLLVGGSAIGALIVFRRDVHAFTEDEQRLASAFADQAAVALQNARLYEESERRRRAAEALLDIARALGSTLELKQLLKIIALRTAQAVGAERCSINLRREGEIVPVMSQFANGHADAILWAKFKAMGPYKLEEVPAHAEAIHAKRPVAIEDTATSALIPAYWVQAFGLRSALVVPLIHQDEVIGTMNLDRTEGPYAWRREQIDLAMTIANQAALAVENARLYRQTEERAQKLTALSRLTRLMTAAREAQEVFHAVARAATTLLGAKMARVWVYHPTDRVLQAQGSFGIDPAVGEAMTEFSTIPPGKGLVGLVFESQTPHYVPDIQEDSRWLNQRLAKEAGLHAFAGLPLMTGDRSVGVLSIIFGERRQFTPEEQELAQLLADQAAIAIESARLYQDVAEKATRLASLLESTKRTAEIKDSSQLLSWIAQEAAVFLKAEGAGIRIAEDEELRLAAHYGYSHEGLEERVALGESGSGWVVRHNRPLAIPDLDRDSRVFRQHRVALRQKGFRSLLAVPMRIGERAIGALYVLIKSPHQFSAPEIEALSGFADQAALAVENLRLYETAHRRARELQDAYEQLRVAQEHLVQSERFNAFGQLAAGVAHDFNNLLAAILGRTQLLLRQERLDANAERSLEVIEQAALDGAQTVQRLRDFTRTQPPRPHGPVDLAELLEEIKELTRPRWESEARAAGITYDFLIEAERVPLIAGDPAELREAFTNLLLNALEAMPKGGQVRLTAVREGERVRITVQDTGCGMAPEVRRRAFEPFFTTKGTHGTGLGLSVVWGIVQRHGGTISLDSEKGKGTTFTLSFPIYTGPVESDAAAPRSWPSRRGRILIIDDDPSVRAVLRDFLEAQSHKVVEAAAGPEGVAKCEAQRFDLVLTDLSMPGMSGWEVAAVLKSRDNLPVGFITGWPGEIDPTRMAATQVDFVLTKPFQLDDVLRCVAQALASDGNPST